MSTGLGDTRVRPVSMGRFYKRQIVRTGCMILGLLRQTRGIKMGVEKWSLWRFLRRVSETVEDGTSHTSWATIRGCRPLPPTPGQGGAFPLRPLSLPSPLTGVCVPGTGVHEAGKEKCRQPCMCMCVSPGCILDAGGLPRSPFQDPSSSPSYQEGWL